MAKEATTVLATAQRAHHGNRERRWQQGVIPSLEMIFSYLELLHDETDYYVEGNVLSCRKWNSNSSRTSSWFRRLQICTPCNPTRTLGPDSRPWSP
ncbi:uncharacterized protein [Equus caballus]|uniref:uncharacterized protein isoform X3 n=1 Tax=Equus caballus TaxID=9796 RepID=UPI0038B2A3D1